MIMSMLDFAQFTHPKMLQNSCSALEFYLLLQLMESLHHRVVHERYIFQKKLSLFIENLQG
jgi:hypothetical protein